jgi:hypothetical protein
MLPRLSLFATCAFALVFCLPGYAQDSPSLGDLARQAQKDKSNAPAKRVLTNDDLPPASAPGSSGLGGSLGTGLGQTGQPTTSGKSGAPSSPSQDLERLEALMNQIDSLDRATLVKNVLQGVDVDFPGRSKWEEKLYAAKLVYASQGHELVQKAKQIVASAEDLKGTQDPNDPRVKDLGNKLKELIRDGVRADADFQAVMLEGRDLASQSSQH